MATTLTTVVAFLSFIFLSGRLALYYVPLAISVGLAMLASVFVAFGWIPVVLNQTWAARLVRRLPDGPDEVHDPRAVQQIVEDVPELEGKLSWAQRIVAFNQHLWWLIVPATVALMIWGGFAYSRQGDQGRLLPHAQRRSADLLHAHARGDRRPGQLRDHAALRAVVDATARGRQHGSDGVRQSGLHGGRVQRRAAAHRRTGTLPRVVDRAGRRHRRCGDLHAWLRRPTLHQGQPARLGAQLAGQDQRLQLEAAAPDRREDDGQGRTQPPRAQRADHRLGAFRPHDHRGDGGHAAS